MRLKTRTWVVLSLLCFIGAGYFWRLGNQRADREQRNRAVSNDLKTNLTATANPKPLLVGQQSLQTVVHRFLLLPLNQRPTHLPTSRQHSKANRRTHPQ